MCFRLNTFGDHGRVEALCEGHYARRNRFVAFIAICTADVGTVDLDDVDREILEVTDRGIAGAEIIDRNANAERLEPAHHIDDFRIPVENTALTEFEFQ